MKKKEVPTKLMSISQYAKSGLSTLTSRQGVLKWIDKGKPLPGVKSFELVGNSYVLTVEVGSEILSK